MIFHLFIIILVIILIYVITDTNHGEYMKYDNWLSLVFLIGLVRVRVSELCDFCNYGFNRLLELVLGLWFK